MQRNIFLLTLASIFLASCEGRDIKSAVGLKKSAPDEFMVISNPPLSMPPEFELDVSSHDQSSNLNMHKSSLSQSDKNFLDQFGGNEDHSNVKNIIDSEARAEAEKKNSKGVIRKTLSKVRETDTNFVDPVSERERIRKNKETGKPINEGVVKTKKQSTLQRIFN